MTLVAENCLSVALPEAGIMNSLFLKGNLSGTSECPLLEASTPLSPSNFCIDFLSLHNKAATDVLTHDFAV